jgi:hypothetical protein
MATPANRARFDAGLRRLLASALITLTAACGGNVRETAPDSARDAGEDSRSPSGDAATASDYPGRGSGSGGVVCEDCGGDCGRCPGVGQGCSWTHQCDEGLVCSATDVCERP